MWPYFKIELSQFFKNKKNIAIYVLLLSFSVFYAIKLAPAYDPIEKVDRPAMEASFLTRDEFLQSKKGADLSRSHPSIRYAVQAFIPWNELEKRRMEALDANDLKAYAAATGEWYAYTDAHTLRGGNFYYNPRYYTYGNFEAHQEGHMAYLAASARYTAYADVDTELTINIFEERTAFQTLYRLIDSYLPYVLFIASLLLSLDIVLKDRHNPSLLRGYPISDWKKLLAKGITAFIGSVLLIVPIFGGLLIIGLQSGFGSLHLPIPVFDEEWFEIITLGNFFAKSAGMILAWYFALISIVLLLSVVVRNEFINLAVGAVLVFAEFAYMSRGLGWRKPIENYLTSYAQIGQVVSKMRNYYYDTAAVTWSFGSLLLLATAGICLLITLLISLSKRYKLV